MKDEQTHCSADEVGVKTHAVAPQIHQLRGGKLFSQQSSDGFTTATLHDSDKVLHHAATRRVLWSETDWCKIFHFGPFFKSNTGRAIKVEISPPISFSRPLQEPP